MIPPRTPGQVARYAWEEAWKTMPTSEAWEAAAQAVLADCREAWEKSYQAALADANKRIAELEKLLGLGKFGAAPGCWSATANPWEGESECGNIGDGATNTRRPE
jgi:hypothetical protein